MSVLLSMERSLLLLGENQERSCGSKPEQGNCPLGDISSRAGSLGSKLFHGRERHGEGFRVLTRKENRR